MFRSHSHMFVASTFCSICASIRFVCCWHKQIYLFLPLLLSARDTSSAHSPSTQYIKFHLLAFMFLLRDKMIQVRTNTAVMHHHSPFKQPHQHGVISPFKKPSRTGNSGVGGGGGQSRNRRQPQQQQQQTNNQALFKMSSFAVNIQTSTKYQQSANTPAKRTSPNSRSHRNSPQKFLTSGGAYQNVNASPSSSFAIQLSKSLEEAKNGGSMEIFAGSKFCTSPLPSDLPGPPEAWLNKAKTKLSTVSLSTTEMIMLKLKNGNVSPPTWSKDSTGNNIGEALLQGLQNGTISKSFQC